MSNQILETNLQFNSGLKKRSSTRRAIIHHSASPDVPASTIHRWHLGQEWSGIGYHFVIRVNGAVERGRPVWAIGAHSGVKGNGDSIGIVLTGNFETGKPTAAQMASLVWLLSEYLPATYGKLTVAGHKDIMQTACPGRNFPWAELKNRLEVASVPDWMQKLMVKCGRAGIIDPAHGHNPNDTSTKWFVLAVMVNLALVMLKAVKNPARHDELIRILEE
ncbi:MAG: hypothetical protein GX808_04065 [Syntrophomonadaceae bacterium]|jgi:N-acetyl-anhydromuramyl-L-alanine amidase AmpD|nr:hypothetical protein [Syntrophomonadaceae bacterium]